MKFDFVGRKFDISDALREYAEKKIGKLDRFFRSEGDTKVTFSAEHGKHTAEVTVRVDSIIFRAHVKTGDMFASIDGAADSIVRQIHKNKTRLDKRIRLSALEKEKVVGGQEVEEDTDFAIVRNKHFDLKPMTPEEAILQMNLLGHKFFVFKNSVNKGAFSVVYKRDGTGYGLIDEQ